MLVASNQGSLRWFVVLLDSAVGSTGIHYTVLAGGIVLWIPRGSKTPRFKFHTSLCWIRSCHTLGWTPAERLNQKNNGVSFGVFRIATSATHILGMMHWCCLSRITIDWSWRWPSAWEWRPEAVCVILVLAICKYLQYFAIFCNSLHMFALVCYILYCLYMVAICCNMLQYFAMFCHYIIFIYFH